VPTSLVLPRSRTPWWRTESSRDASRTIGTNPARPGDVRVPASACGNHSGLRSMALPPVVPGPATKVFTTLGAASLPCSCAVAPPRLLTVCASWYLMEWNLVGKSQLGRGAIHGYCVHTISRRRSSGHKPCFVAHGQSKDQDRAKHPSIGGKLFAQPLESQGRKEVYLGR
jgi:hypothetical protein